MSATKSAGRADPSVPATLPSQVHTGIPLSTKFCVLLATLIASAVINNRTDGHTILTKLSYLPDIRPEDDHLYRRPTLRGVLNALASIFVQYSEVVATTAINSVGDVATDILTTVTVQEAEDPKKLEEVELRDVADFVLIQNSDRNDLFDKDSSNHCVLVPGGEPFNLEPSKPLDLDWWTNLIEQM